MAQCMTCKRTLPPSGACVYCGKDVYRDTKFHKRGGGWAWLGNAARIAGAIGVLYGAYWILFTDSGAKFVSTMRDKLGIKASRRDPGSPAQTILAKHAKVDAMIADATITIEEENLGEGHFIVRFIRREGADLRTTAFQVNTGSGDIHPLDNNGAGLLR